MTVTGRPAQFGRGVMAEVGGRIIGKFASNLAAELSGEGAAQQAESAGAAATPAEATQVVSTPAAENPGRGNPGAGCGRRDRRRGRRRGRAARRSGPAADRGAEPAGPVVQQPAARGRAHGRRPHRPHREGTARHRRARAPVHQGDQGQARGPRAGPHHARGDRGGGGHGHARRRPTASHQHGHHEQGTTAAGTTATGPHEHGRHRDTGTTGTGPAATGSTATGTGGPRPAPVSPGARTGAWDAGAPPADRPAANGLLPPRGARPQDEDALDLLSVAGLPLLKRFAPVLGGLILAGVLVRIVRRRRRAARA